MVVPVAAAVTSAIPPFDPALIAPARFKASTLPAIDPLYEAENDFPFTVAVTDPLSGIATGQPPYCIGQE